jgi:hypothetical protein
MRVTGGRCAEDLIHRGMASTSPVVLRKAVDERAQHRRFALGIGTAAIGEGLCEPGRRGSGTVPPRPGKRCQHRGLMAQGRAEMPRITVRVKQSNGRSQQSSDDALGGRLLLGGFECLRHVLDRGIHERDEHRCLRCAMGVHETQRHLRVVRDGAHAGPVEAAPREQAYRRLEYPFAALLSERGVVLVAAGHDRMLNERSCNVKTGAPAVAGAPMPMPVPASSLLKAGSDLRDDWVLGAEVMLEDNPVAHAYTIDPAPFEPDAAWWTRRSARPSSACPRTPKC